MANWYLKIANARRQARDHDTLDCLEELERLLVSNETPKSQRHETKSHRETDDPQPWKAEGISRATYFRRKAKEAA